MSYTEVISYGDYVVSRRPFLWAFNYRSHHLRAPIEIRWLEEVRVCIMMNEALAGLCLPDSLGKIDFSTGFRSKNPIFHRWCRDLFSHYWEEAGKALQREEAPT